jgi:hypothetical protein
MFDQSPLLILDYEASARVGAYKSQSVPLVCFLEITQISKTMTSSQTHIGGLLKGILYDYVFASEIQLLLLLRSHLEHIMVYTILSYRFEEKCIFPGTSLLKVLFS